MSADSWTLEEFEEYLEYAPPIEDLEVKFLDSLDWRQLHRLANHYNLNIRGDRATYLSQLKAKRECAIARRDKTTTSSSAASTSAAEEAQHLSAQKQVEESDKEEDDVAIESHDLAPSAPTHQPELRDLDAKIDKLQCLHQQEILSQQHLLRSPTKETSDQVSRDTSNTASVAADDGGECTTRGITTPGDWNDNGGAAPDTSASSMHNNNLEAGAKTDTEMKKDSGRMDGTRSGQLPQRRISSGGLLRLTHQPSSNIVHLRTRPSLNSKTQLHVQNHSWLITCNKLGITARLVYN
jgi:hypothetical protein